MAILGDRMGKFYLYDRLALLFANDQILQSAARCGAHSPALTALDFGAAAVSGGPLGFDGPSFSEQPENPIATAKSTAGISDEIFASRTLIRDLK